MTSSHDHVRRPGHPSDTLIRVVAEIACWHGPAAGATVRKSCGAVTACSNEYAPPLAVADAATLWHLTSSGALAWRRTGSPPTHFELALWMRPVKRTVPPTVTRGALSSIVMSRWPVVMIDGSIV